MHFSVKYSISLLFLLSLCIYQTHASIGAEAAPLNATDDLESCICGRQYTPVCASDSKTYGNRCLYECARKKLNAQGRSLSLVRSGVCPGEPVGRRNAKATAAETVVESAAEEDTDLDACICDRSLQPVCGSDLRTYGNRCLFDCKRSVLARLGKVLSLLREGACSEKVVEDGDL
ncbi:ovomucoid [Ceratitis capitata]|uniref:(Mediterranean fruit fly) hypothetical protein n=1 Tax=Ceratitis capitata TaxID=7213 RepID=W8BWY9_CERCA|nr:ovomucoid [Ceratitis capitata]CAD6998169.1 unnamed protein product [Ceratitis capitata]